MKIVVGSGDYIESFTKYSTWHTSKKYSFYPW